jgi:C4-dicarboxylate transporter DctQ subunit
MRSAFIQIADAFERVTAFLLTTLMAVMVFIGAFQVLSRFVLHEPSPWSEEVLRRAMIWLVALGLSIGFRQGLHISVDVINRVKAAWVRGLVHWAVFGITFVFLAMLIWLGADMAWRVRFQTFASMEISMTWAYMAIPVGAALSLISLVARALTPSAITQDGDELGGLQCQV